MLAVYELVIAAFRHYWGALSTQPCPTAQTSRNTQTNVPMALWMAMDLRGAFWVLGVQRFQTGGGRAGLGR